MAIDDRPVILRKAFLVRIVAMCDSGDRAGDNDFLGLVLMSCPHDCECSLDCWLNKLIFILRLVLDDKRRRSVNDVVCAFTAVDDRLLIEQVCLDELKLLEEIAKRFAQGFDFLLVSFASDCATNYEATMAQEVQADLGADVAADAGDGDARL